MMIYVHIPFCHAKCAYCDFYSTPDLRRMEALAERIIQEYQLRKDELTGAPSRNTLYFGGGTPSIMPTSLLGRIAHNLFRPEVTEEFTIEVNPEDVNAENVEAWRAIGVNRVSMGIQSFNDDELKAVGRRHSSREALEAIDILRKGGIDNLSCDLIYGLPGQTVESWKKSLETLISAAPEHISAYCLSYEPGTILTRRLQQGRISAASDETIEDMYAALCSGLRQAGYEHYEISNFGLPGRHSRHNSGYWTGEPYLGLGPGAHSLDSKGVRRFNRPNLREYLGDNFPVAVVDEENSTDRINDRIITSLRTSDGLDPEDIPAEIRGEFLELCRPFLNNGTLIDDNGSLRIPEKEWLRSDSILREIII